MCGKRGDTSPERQRREGNNRPVAVLRACVSPLSATFAENLFCVGEKEEEKVWV